MASGRWGNGHWYQQQEASGCIQDDIQFAEDLAGSLLCVNSHEEWMFITEYALSQSPVFRIGALGPAITGGSWEWVSGEEWTVEFWAPANSTCPNTPYPNNGSSGAQVVVNDCDDVFGGLIWDDYGFCDNEETVIVEWSSDCNNDGIVDYGQIRDGSTRDLNANGVPDNCEATEWTLEAGGNGHFYQLIFIESSGDPVVLSGTEIQELVPDGAYLATLTSPQENDFVSFNVADDIRAWLPLNGGDSNDRTAGPFIGLIGQGECNYGWVSGEPLEYTNWHPGNPGECDFALCQLWEYGGDRRWQDHTLGVEAGNSFVLEWSDDCNDDGIVDIAQIISGTFVDSDFNGIPDQCEFGACCVDGNCVVALASSCADSGGQFSGAGSTCNFIECEPSVDDCPGDITDDGQVDFTDLLIIVSTWGPCSDG